MEGHAALPDLEGIPEVLGPEAQAIEQDVADPAAQDDPEHAKKIRSSTSLAFQVEPGRAARSRASHQPPAKPSRYMIPYQWTLTGPISKAIGLKPGYCSMAA